MSEELLGKVEVVFKKNNLVQRYPELTRKYNNVKDRMTRMDKSENLIQNIFMPKLDDV